jgi:hypothetical protein
MYTLLPYLTYVLTPCSWVLAKLSGLELVKKFPAFYGTRSLITAFTNACHLPLSRASSIQAIPPHPTSWRPILTLSSHLRLGLPSGLFPSGFSHENPVHPSPLHHPSYMPAHLILLDFITRTIVDEKYRSWSSSLWSFLYTPVTSSLLGPNKNVHVEIFPFMLKNCII